MVDKKGNKYKIKTFVNYGAIVTTCILPELRPIDIECIAGDGYAFSRLRDADYRGNGVIDEQRILAVANEIDRGGILYPNINNLYCLLHPSNIASLKMNTLFESDDTITHSEVVVDGTAYIKVVMPVSTHQKVANRIKEKCLEI